mmetsp:Transcript_85822/g.199502  ORF Transcript_85822/g.199502 Transcript_85822/m.199502 type:complete len:427 (+) Transcript_85822:38-1318(+)
MEPYRVEPAKTARSKCKACKSQIEKDELRFGSLLDVFGGSGSYMWRCITCITAKVAANVESKLASLEDVAGYPALTPGQQAQFRKAFEKAKGGPAVMKAKKAEPKPAAARQPPVKASGTGRAKPMPSEKEQHTFLDFAKNRDFKEVRKLVESNPLYVNVQPAMRWTALHQAAEQGDMETIKFLLAHGAKIDLKTKDGKTPHDVAKAAAVKKLLEAPPAKRAAPSGGGPAKRAKPDGAKGERTLYCDETEPLSKVDCEDLYGELVEALPLDQAPKAPGAIAKRIAGILGDACLPAGESDGPGVVIVIANPEDDLGTAFMEGLCMAKEAEDGEVVLADIFEKNDRDWSDYVDTGFCFSLDDDDDDEDEEDEGEEDRKARIKAVTKIMAEELTDHFELNFDDSLCVGPKLYGGYKDGDIVGVLSYRVWT